MIASTPQSLLLIIFPPASLNKEKDTRLVSSHPYCWADVPWWEAGNYYPRRDKLSYHQYEQCKGLFWLLTNKPSPLCQLIPIIISNFASIFHPPEYPVLYLKESFLQSWACVAFWYFQIVLQSLGKHNCTLGKSDNNLVLIYFPPWPSKTPNRVDLGQFGIKQSITKDAALK